MAHQNIAPHGSHGPPTPQHHSQNHSQRNHLHHSNHQPPSSHGAAASNSSMHSHPHQGGAAHSEESFGLEMQNLMAGHGASTAQVRSVNQGSLGSVTAGR